MTGHHQLGCWLRTAAFGLCASSCLAATAPAQGQAQSPPNSLVIMGDDVGWFNIGAYHRGVMSGRTPNLDRLAGQGMMFPTITRKQVAPRAERTSSLASCRCAPG